MRERIKKFIALVMMVLVLNQLPGFEALVLYAASVNMYANTTVSANTEDTYVFSSGGVTLTVDAGVTVGGIEASIVGNTNRVQSSGTVNSVNHTAGETILTGGYYGNIYVAEGPGGGVTGNSISAGTITADGPIHLEGTNTVGTLTSANDLAGTGTVTVTDELTIPGTSTIINVNKDTIINATNSDVTVYNDGVDYIFAGGTSGNSILKNFGVYVTFQTEDENINWELASGTDNINSYLWFGESTGKYKLTAVEGYCFPDDYATKLVIDGSGSYSFDYLSNTEVQISYTVSDYDSGTVTITFPALEKLILDGKGTFAVDDIAYGGTIKPQYTSSTQSIADAVVEYKVSGADDTTYTTTAPTAVGSYTARVTIPEDDDNYELVMTDDFVITKLTGEGKLNVADTYYGVAVSPEISSGTNLVSGVAVEYKVAGASDLTYTQTKPTAVGNYVARAVLPGNDILSSVTLTDEFSIGYMPVPQNGYHFVGTLGSNNYYTSDVTVVANDGYAISRTLDGEYVGQFVIDNSSSSTYIYFIDVNTGAKSTGVLMSAVKIDMEIPTVSAENKKTYYADSLAVSIEDANLASITVNGQDVDITGDSTVLDLKSNGGVEEYTVVVTDMAGNVKNMTITVASEWTKTGEIPSGSPVKLQSGKTYTLGAGTWTVSGDATSYSGNTTFYVAGEGQFTFNQH